MYLSYDKIGFQPPCGAVRVLAVFVSLRCLARPYNTHRGRTDRKFLITPQYSTPEHKRKQINYTLAFDAAAIWNNLPENIRNSMYILPTKAQISLFRHGFSTMALKILSEIFVLCSNDKCVLITAYV